MMFESTYRTIVYYSIALGKKENKRYRIAQEIIMMQAAKIEKLFQQFGTRRDIGSKL
jgi:hypothetical protein